MSKFDRIFNWSVVAFMVISVCIMTWAVIGLYKDGTIGTLMLVIFAIAGVYISKGIVLIALDLMEACRK